MFEIRNYHFPPANFGEYKAWAESLALPYIRRKLDVVGYWVDNGMAAEYSGSLPKEENAARANITWIARWKDRAERDKVWQDLSSDVAWQEILSQVPGGQESFLRIEAKFATEL